MVLATAATFANVTLRAGAFGVALDIRANGTLDIDVAPLPAATRETFPFV